MWLNVLVKALLTLVGCVLFSDLLYIVTNLNSFLVRDIVTHVIFWALFCLPIGIVSIRILSNDKRKKNAFVGLIMWVPVFVLAVAGALIYKIQLKGYYYVAPAEKSVVVVEAIIYYLMILLLLSAVTRFALKALEKGGGTGGRH